MGWEISLDNIWNESQLLLHLIQTGRGKQNSCNCINAFRFNRTQKCQIRNIETCFKIKIDLSQFRWSCDLNMINKVQKYKNLKRDSSLKNKHSAITHTFFCETQKETFCSLYAAFFCIETKQQKSIIEVSKVGHMNSERWNIICCNRVQHLHWIMTSIWVLWLQKTWNIESKLLLLFFYGGFFYYFWTHKIT